MLCGAALTTEPTGHHFNILGHFPKHHLINWEKMVDQLIMKIIIKCSLTLLTGFTHSDVTQLQQQMFGLVNVLFISPSGCIFPIQLVCLFFLYSFGYRLSHSTSLHFHFEHNFFAKKDKKKKHNKLFFFFKFSTDIAIISLL